MAHTNRRGAARRLCGRQVRERAPPKPWSSPTEGRAFESHSHRLDIDYAPLEEELVRQLMANASVLALVDEFYFEHHVRGSAMEYQGWGHNSPSTLSDSYNLFTKLRDLGVRAHSWV